MSDWGRSSQTSKGADEQSSRRAPGSHVDPGVCFSNRPLVLKVGSPVPLHHGRCHKRRMSNSDKQPATRLVEGGRRKAWRGRLVNPPVERASTILFDSVAEMESGTAALGSYRYGLQGTATHWALSEALTELEPGAAGTALFPSGLAAITSTLLAILSPGDELLAPDSVYGPTRKFCATSLKRFGVTTRYYDPLTLPQPGPQTRAILLESPGALTMEVQDVPAITALARERGIVTIIDNTWATPLLFPAIAAGVDISVMAGTKYVGGH